MLVPMAQEISDKPCDVGTNRTELETGTEGVLEDVDVKFGPVERIDYGLLEEGWNGKVCSAIHSPEGRQGYGVLLTFL